MRKAGLAPSESLLDQLESYFRLLAVWNKRMNLSGMDLEEASPEAIDRILVEPVAAARLVPVDARRTIDIGSGGGSPAIPMALASGTALVMVESKSRKAVFLKEATRTLGMTDVAVEAARFEELLEKPMLQEAHDVLTIRAVRTEPKVLLSLQAFVAPGGHLLLFESEHRTGAREFAPPLAWCQTVPLLESTRSVVQVLQKLRQPGR